MNIKNKTYQLFTYLLFAITTLYSFSISQLYYLTSKGPDYDFYKPYFDYFFGSINETGVEQGLIYYFLHAFIATFNSEYLNDFHLDQHMSNSIQIGNFVFYIMGLIGIYKFLKNRKYNKKTIFVVLSLINIFPPAIEMRLLFKPEILIFCCLIWIIVFLDSYIDTHNFRYLLYAIPPLVFVATIKANLAMMVGIFLILFYLKNIYKIDKNYFCYSVVLFTILFSLLTFENFSANSLFIFQHQSPEEFTGRAEFDFLYNIDFKSIWSNPFRESQKNSFIGILLLDTFDDYFGNFWTDDSSPLSLNRIIYFSIKETAFIGMFFTLMFYIFLIVQIKKNKNNRLIYLTPFIGIVIQMVVSQFTQYNPETGDVAKTYYYSFFLVIAFTLFAAELSKINFKILVTTGVAFAVLILHVYGFPKENDSDQEKYLNYNNQINILCEINNNLLSNVNTDCIPRDELFCYQTYESVNKTTIRNSKYITSTVEPIKKLTLFKDNTAYKVINLDDCIEKIKENYYPAKVYSIKNIPIFNILNFMFFILFISLYSFEKKKTDRPSYIY